MIIYGNHNAWFGEIAGRPFRFDLPDFYNMIFFILLIPIFIGFIMRNYQNKEVHWFNLYIAPIIATLGAVFLIYALVISSWIHALIYSAVFVILALIGFCFMNSSKKK